MANTQNKTPAKKSKLVRDSFTIPKAEFVVIEDLKIRAIALGTPVKKSELLRAGLKLLQSLNDNAYKAALAAVPTLKTGRPMSEEPVVPVVETSKPARKPVTRKTVIAKPAVKTATKVLAKPATPTVAKPVAKPTTKPPVKRVSVPKVVPVQATQSATQAPAAQTPEKL